MTPLLLGPFGFQELLLILAILLLFFGATKLPMIGRGLGEGIRNFKSGLRTDDKNERLDEGSVENEASNPR